MSVINFSGLASGIDSEALIKATTDAMRTQRVEPNETKISELEETNSAVDELKTKFETLKTALSAFTDKSGGGLVKQGGSSDETRVSATATNAASNGSYNLTVTQLAKNETVSLRSSAGTGIYNSATLPIAPTMTSTGSPNDRVIFTIGSPTTETVNMTITPTTTLTEFVNTFNDNSLKAEATLVNVGTSASPDYRIVVNSLATGVAAGSISMAVGTDITSVGAFDTNSEDNAANATFSIAGIGTITRQTNTINDVIPGVTFNLRSLGSATVSISDDSAATASKVQEFVDAFNDIVTFVKENNQITREEEGQSVNNVFNALAKVRIDDNALSSVRSKLSEIVYDPNPLDDDDDEVEIRIFSDIGITTERDGTLKFDTDIFTSAVTKEPQSVQFILNDFAEETAVTGTLIDQYIRFNGLFDITINGNKELITSLNARIATAESAILKQEEQMRRRFSNLESLVGRLQSQQTALTSALSGLGGN